MGNRQPDRRDKGVGPYPFFSISRFRSRRPTPLQSS